MTGLYPHELRHTAASLAITSGASVKAVQRMLGHASAILTLDRYGHIFRTNWTRSRLAWTTPCAHLMWSRCGPDRSDPVQRRWSGGRKWPLTWCFAAFKADLSNKTPLRFLAAGYADPHAVKRLGRARIARFIYRHSRGAWGDLEADVIVAAAKATTELWDEELSFVDLAEDIAVEARLAQALTEELKEVDERIALLVRDRDPNGIITSAPGVGAVTSGVILGRLGDATRFHSLAVRGYSGLVPSLDASGVSGRHGGPTKRGDALLREALFLSANQARRIDPTLAAKYHRLMVETGKHHNSALCHIATTLLTRITACVKSETPDRLVAESQR